MIKTAFLELAHDRNEVLKTITSLTLARGRPREGAPIENATGKLPKASLERSQFSRLSEGACTPALFITTALCRGGLTARTCFWANALLEEGQPRACFGARAGDERLDALVMRACDGSTAKEPAHGRAGSILHRAICFSAPTLGHFPLRNLEPEQATAGPAAGPQLHLRVRWPYSRYARGCGHVEGAVKVVIWAGSAARRHRAVSGTLGFPPSPAIQGRKQGIKHCCVCQCYLLRSTECRVSGKGFWTGSAGIHPGLPCWRIAHWHTVRWSWAVWHATFFHRISRRV